MGAWVYRLVGWQFSRPELSGYRLSSLYWPARRDISPTARTISWHCEGVASNRAGPNRLDEVEAAGKICAPTRGHSGGLIPRTDGAHHLWRVHSPAHPERGCAGRGRGTHRGSLWGGGGAGAARRR